MQRKAQVTLFLIIGIGVVIGLGYLMYASSVNQQARVSVETEKLNSLQLQINPLNNYMTSCVNDLLKDSLDTAGLDPDAIAQYVKDQVETTCDLQTFKDRGLDIQPETPQVTVDVQDRVILLRVQYPLTIKQGSQQAKLQTFATQIPLQITQPVTLDTTNPTQPKTTEPVTLLSPDNKLDLTIQPRTTFYDSTGNPLTYSQATLTIQPADPPVADEVSKIQYDLKLDDQEASSATNPVFSGPSNPPVRATTYTHASSDVALYYYDNNPTSPEWKKEPTVLSEETEEEVELTGPLSPSAVQTLVTTVRSLFPGNPPIEEKLKKLEESDKPKKQEKSLEELQAKITEELVQSIPIPGAQKEPLKKTLQELFATNDPTLLSQVSYYLNVVPNAQQDLFLNKVNTLHDTFTNTLAGKTTEKKKTTLTSPVRKITKIKKGKK